MRLLLNWLLSALAVWIVSQVVPGIHVNSATTTLIAALVIGLINATVGMILKVLTFPLTILTLGLFYFVLNGLLLLVASYLLPGYHVAGLIPAILGSLVITVVNWALHALFGSDKKRDSD